MIIINTIRDDICALALSKLNNDYVHGGFGPDTFDCAGLVWYAYNEILGIDIFDGGYGISTTTMMRLEIRPAPPHIFTVMIGKTMDMSGPIRKDRRSPVPLASLHRERMNTTITPIAMAGLLTRLTE